MGDELYTLGVWTVRAGKEADFIREWTDFARWTKSQFEGAVSVLLLQDRNDPRRFVSVGPWRSPADVARWRASEGFRDRVAALQHLLEHFEPGSFAAVFQIPE